MFYKVEWQTGDRSWLRQQDVSEFAKDVYWIQKHEKAVSARYRQGPRVRVRVRVRFRVEDLGTYKTTDI